MIRTTKPHLGPAAKLNPGDILDSRWTIEKRMTRSAHGTGGTFSVPYLAKDSTGKPGFLKAMDFHRGLSAPDPATAIHNMTEAFNFEKGVLEYCRSQRLSRIVQLIDSGVHRPNPGRVEDVIQFLVFEVAEGDIRAYIAGSRIWERAIALRTIHGVAAALQQLHRANVAHQDVKPSNILLFKDKSTKLADVGRSFRVNENSPHQSLSVAGDKTYAPPERLFEDGETSWERRRAACDMYLLGNLIVFVLTQGLSMTSLLLSYMDEQHHPTRWSGPYADILPYIVDAFDRILLDLTTLLDADYVAELPVHLRQLCHPNPGQRGHPTSIREGFNQYSLERYVSIFDRLASRAEISVKRDAKLRA